MLNIIVLTIMIALIMNLVLKRFHLPTIIGYIMTGTVIAYAFDLHSAASNHDLKEIAEFGIVFLMFTIGLEFSINHLMHMKYDVLVIGTLQIVATGALVVLASVYLFDINLKAALIIASAIALSSTAIVLKTFNESGEINKKFGRKVLGILLMQDIAVIPMLLMIGFFAVENQSVGKVLLGTLTSAAILIVVLWIAGKYLLEPFFHQISDTDSGELFIGSVFLVVMGASYLAYYFGFSYSLGAFIAGMLMAETKYKHQVEADLIPFRDLLLGVFFITVGMQIDFSVIGSHIFTILVLLPVVMAIKFFVIYLIVRIGDSRRVAMKTALSLVQIGEFSLAILELARSKSLLQPPYGQILIVVIVASMILTPIILKNLSKLTDLLVVGRREPDADISCITKEMSDHIVVFGYGYFGQQIAKILKRQNALYLVVENNINFYKQAQADGVPVVFGNAAQKHILQKASIADASTVIVAIDNPQKRYLVCSAIDKLNHSVKTIVKVSREEEKKMLEALNITNIVVQGDEIARIMAERALFEI